MQNTPISKDHNSMEPEFLQGEYLIPLTALLHLFSDNAILTNPSTNGNIIDASNDIDAIRTWLHEYRNSHNTFIAYRQCIERYFIWISQYNKKLSEVKREDVQNYQDFLADPQPSATWCGPKASRSSNNWKPFVTGLSASSINHQILIIKNLYNYLQNAGYLERNPFALMNAKRKHSGL